MGTFIKWWKDETLLKIIVSMLSVVIVAFLFAYFIPYGWIASIILALGIGRFYIRPLFRKKLNEIADKLLKDNDNHFN